MCRPQGSMCWSIPARARPLRAWAGWRRRSGFGRRRRAPRQRMIDHPAMHEQKPVSYATFCSSHRVPFRGPGSAQPCHRLPPLFPDGVGRGGPHRQPRRASCHPSTRRASPPNSPPPPWPCQPVLRVKPSEHTNGCPAAPPVGVPGRTGVSGPVKRRARGVAARPPRSGGATRVVTSVPRAEMDCIRLVMHRKRLATPGLDKHEWVRGVTPAVASAKLVCSPAQRQPISMVRCPRTARAKVMRWGLGVNITMLERWGLGGKRDDDGCNRDEGSALADPVAGVSQTGPSR